MYWLPRASDRTNPGWAPLLSPPRKRRSRKGAALVDSRLRGNDTGGRRGRRTITWEVLSSLVLLVAAPACAGPGTRTEPLFADTGFSRGFLLSYPDSARGRAVEKVLDFGDTNNVPAWRLCQWATQYSLATAPCIRDANGTLSYENEAKRVVVGRSESANRGLILDIRGSAEYGSRARKQGESWPHLLVEQDALRLHALDELREVRLRIRVRLLYSRSGMSAAEYDPSLHAAQFQMFFIVRNIRPGSAERGNYFWFGVPFYDSRYDIPPAYQAADAGKKDATGKFIYTVAGQALGETSLKTGQWLALDVDLLPHILRGLREAVASGYLKSSAPHDYAVANMNLGWEIPGTFDAAVQVQNLEISAVLRDGSDDVTQRSAKEQREP
jgi:hypothetical protein